MEGQQAEIRRETAYAPNIADDPLERVDALLTRKEAILARVRKHLRTKALLEVWLYVHVPITFALIAALSARHIGVESMDSKAACRTYNVLMGEGRKVTLALIINPVKQPG